MESTQWQYLVMSIIVPFMVGMLKKLKWADELKAATAFGVSIVVAAGGALLTGQFTLAQLPGNAAMIFGSATVLYRLMKWSKPQ